ncbi:MAG: TIGR00270 family protein [Thermoplasmata archaeon]|nr:MAG: TIGR00270 family protein [Thermoplasmata archaeon]
MICEMCGIEVPRLKRIVIEGSNLNVCTKCEKFGQDHAASDEAVVTFGRDTIAERLERREKRLKGKDVLEGSGSELALDYPKRIRDARSKMGMNQEQLAKKINEKRSVVAKLETGDMVPDNKLIKKLERALEISLMEAVSPVSAPKHREEARSMTLGDFIKIKKK